MATTTATMSGERWPRASAWPSIAAEQAVQHDRRRAADVTLATGIHQATRRTEPWNRPDPVADDAVDEGRQAERCVDHEVERQAGGESDDRTLLGSAGHRRADRDEQEQVTSRAVEGEARHQRHLQDQCGDQHESGLDGHGVTRPGRSSRGRVPQDDEHVAERAEVGDRVDLEHLLALVDATCARHRT